MAESGFRSGRAVGEPGLVVASHGRHCMVEKTDGSRVICHPRGKKTQAVVGDRVLWLASQDEGTIEAIEARRNLFYRQDELRSKSFAANIDQVLIVLAAEPEFSESQLARALIAAEAEGIASLVVLNKRDLEAPFANAWKRLAPYRDMGYTVLPLSLAVPLDAAPGAHMPSDAAADADADRSALLARLAAKATLVLGPSGAGKSTLVNWAAPGTAALTGAISHALKSGKHTTTSSNWYWIDRADASAVIDSPGFQEFGLRHIQAMQLANLMPDLRAYLGQCRFYNCTHLHEPGCEVIAHVAANELAGKPDENPVTNPAAAISPSRYRIYTELFAQLSERQF